MGRCHKHDVIYKYTLQQVYCLALHYVCLTFCDLTFVAPAALQGTEAFPPEELGTTETRHIM